MPQTGTVNRFVRALQKYEKTSDLQDLVALFSNEAELGNLATPSPLRGRAGVYRFWRDYRSSFREVETQFIRISPESSPAVLEWVSHGVLPSGTSFRYRGVTLLDIAGDFIARFQAYYDTAVFLQQGAKHAAA